MTYQKTITIKAKTEAEADQIATAMGKMSGHFSGKEWTAIGSKISEKLVRMRIRMMI